MQQQSGSCLLAVIGTEPAQVRGIGNSGTSRRLHFDRQQLAICLDHEVHLLAHRRAPIAQLRTFHARVAPGHQIVQDEILEMHARRRLDFGQMHRETCIAQVDLRRLDDTLGSIPGVGRQATSNSEVSRRVSQRCMVGCGGATSRPSAV